MGRLLYQSLQGVAVFRPPVAQNLHLVAQAEVLDAEIHVVLGVLDALDFAPGLDAVFQRHTDAVPLRLLAAVDPVRSCGVFPTAFWTATRPLSAARTMPCCG